MSVSYWLGFRLLLTREPIVFIWLHVQKPAQEQIMYVSVQYRLFFNKSINR